MKYTGLLLMVLFAACNTNRTTESGSWYELSFPGNKNINHVNFLNNDLGVALVSTGTILITRDGGNSWNEYQIAENENFVSSYILNSEEIFIGRNRLFKSFDGGVQFKELGAGTIDYASSITGIHFYDSETGVIVKAGTVFTTTDGGLIWTKKYTEFGFASDLEVVGNLMFISGGITYDQVSVGELHRSADSGASWEKVDLPKEIARSEIMAIDFLDSDTGYILTFDRKIYRSDDSGNTWELVKSFSDSIPFLRDLSFINKSVGYLISLHHVFRTEDGGKSWTLDAKPDAELLQIETSSESSVFVSTRNGIIKRIQSD